MAGEIAQAFVRIRPDTTGFRRDTENSVERALSSVRVRTRVFSGVTAAATGVAGLGAAFIQGARTSIDFDRGLRNVNSIAKLTDDTLKRVGSSIEDISEVSGRGPKELVSALYDVVSSGFSARDALVVLQASSKAATAGLTDAATSTKAIDAALNAYHLTADQATKVSDVLFQVVNKGVLTFEELAQNMGDLVPAAAPLGISLEEVGSAIATITLQGVPAAEAATRVKNTMLQLASPSKALAGLLRENGFASGEAAVRSLGYAGVLDLITKATGGSVTATSKLFPEIRSLLGVVGVTGKNAATYVNVLRSMGDATKGVGATQRAFTEQTKSVGFQWDQTKAILAKAAIDVGELLFPALRAGGTGIQELAHGFETARPAIGEFIHDIGAVRDAVAPIATTVAGALRGVAGGINQFTDIAGILAFAAGFKAVSVATSIATSARVRYAAVVAASRGATASAAAAEVGEAGAVTASTAALVANTAALEANIAATTALGGAQLRLGGTSTLAGVGSLGGIGKLGGELGAAEKGAATLSGRLSTLGRGLFTLAGGAQTAAAVGIGALAFGIFKIVTADSEWESANKSLTKSLADLDAGLARARGFATEYSDALSSIKSDKVAVEVAKTNVALAQQALKTTDAARGTAQYGSLVAGLASAQDALRTATRTLSQDEDRAGKIRKEKVNEEIDNEQRRASAVAEAQKVADAAIDKQRQQSAGRFGNASGIAGAASEEGRRAAALRSSAKAADDFATAISKQAADLSRGDPVLRKQLALLGDYSKEVGKLPPERITKLVLGAPNFKAALAAVVVELGKMEKEAKEHGFTSGQEFAKAFAKGETDGFLGIAGLLRSAIKIAGDAGGEAGKSAADKAAAGLEKVKGSVSDVNKQIKKVGDSVRSAAEDLAQANERLADTIRAGHDQVESAISQADQNLFSIGESLSSTVGEFLDALNKSDKASELTPDSKLFKKLRQQILEGNGGPETRRAAEELAQKIESAQAKAEGKGNDRIEKQKETTKRQIADLVDQFNKGAISLATFNKRVATVLSKDGISYKNAGKLLGVAFADGFKAQVEGLRAQAQAIAAGPRRPGRTGQEPSIVRPLEVLRDSQKEIAAAQKDRDIAAREVAKDTRRLSSLQERHQRLLLQESRAQTAQLKAIRTQLKADAKASRLALSRAQRRTTLAPDDRDIGPRRGDANRRAKSAADHGYTP